MEYKGFSLIELMVVIAIVALLATVAAPAYKQYVEKARMVEVKSILDSILSRSINYYNDTGVFGNVAQIGHPINENDTYADVSSYSSIGEIYLEPGSDSCPSGRLDAVIYNLNKEEDKDNNQDPYIFYSDTAADVDGIIKKACMYSYYSGNPPTRKAGNFIPGCVNSVELPQGSDLGRTLSSSCN